MARMRRPEPEPTPRALVSSARPVKVDKMSGAQAALKGEGWQDLTWRFYNTVGEFRAACNWVGNVLSRASLYVTYDDGSGPKRVEEGSIGDLALDEFFNGRRGQTQMLHDLGVFYSAPGEAYLAGWSKKKKGKETWTWGVYDASEVMKKGDDWYVSGDKVEGQITLIRTWRPHPKKRKKADSPARAALPVLQEIERTTAHISKQLTSRLASAGILLLPNEMTVTTTVEATDDGSDQTTISARQMVEQLAAVAGRAISDPSDSAANVPIVITADGEHLDKPRLLEFWSELDAAVQQMRDNAVKRLALAMDMPPEVLTGLGETNHWGAWQIDESAVKSHTEPLLAQITYDLTEGYLRPALEGEVEDPERYAIAADTTEMRLRPNRSQEAMELFDRGALSGAALLRETGFDPSDAMGDEERKVWLLMKAAMGSTTPEIVVEAMRLLGAPLPEQVYGDEPTEGRPAPSLDEHPGVEPPSEVPAALVAAADQMVWRALERAGNRLASRMNGGRKPANLDAASVYLFVALDAPAIDEALKDAWTTCGRTASRHGWEPKALESALSEYVAGLMKRGQQHDYDLLAAHLAGVKR